MIIETERLRFAELTLKDASTIAHIAKDMAWNDTIQLLLRKDLTEENFVKNGATLLSTYRKPIISLAEENVGKRYLDFQAGDIVDLYKKISMDVIPEKYWHINFSQLKPDFKESAKRFIQGAIKRRESEPRFGFWLAIIDKRKNKLIGATTISTKMLDKDGVAQIGHSGQFIHPEFQKKGYISETKAVMVDFMYKYLVDMNITPIAENSVFYTTCHELNQGSKALQNKSGAVPVGYIADDNKVKFYATRENLECSRLMSRKVLWKAALDNGKILTSAVSEKKLSVYNTIQQLKHFHPKDKC